MTLQFDLTCLRQVSLAGKSKSRTQETKQDFLERTRREREARETQRRREKAALDVQVFWSTSLQNVWVAVFASAPFYFRGTGAFRLSDLHFCAH